MTNEQEAVHIAEIKSHSTERNDVIASIRQALKERSGYTYSVTGGRGTAWGWISIDVAPRDRDNVLKANGLRSQLAGLLGLQRVHFQGENIPASNAYYRLYLARARYGCDLGFEAKPYWD